MHKKSSFVLIGCACIGMVLLGHFFPAQRHMRGHRLVGSWTTAPGELIPESLALNEDGTGGYGSGVGNFRFDWRLLKENGSRCRILTSASSTYQEGSGEWEFEFLDANTISRGGHCVLHRQNRSSKTGFAAQGDAHPLPQFRKVNDRIERP